MACQDCDSCNSSCEGSCEENKQSVSEAIGEFYFRGTTYSLDTDSKFLTAQEWNNLIDKIVAAYSLGGLNAEGVDKYNNQSIRAGIEYDNEFMTANMWNGAYIRMKWATTNNDSFDDKKKTGGSSGDIIYAKYFTELEKYFNDEFKVNYCDECDDCDSCDNDHSCCNTDSGGSGGGSSGGEGCSHTCLGYL